MIFLFLYLFNTKKKYINSYAVVKDFYTNIPNGTIHNIIISQFYKLYYDMKGYDIFDKNYLQSLNRVIKKIL